MRSALERDDHLAECPHVAEYGVEISQRGVVPLVGIGVANSVPLETGAVFQVSRKFPADERFGKACFWTAPILSLDPAQFSERWDFWAPGWNSEERSLVRLWSYRRSRCAGD